MSLQDAKLILTPNAYKASKLYAVKPTDGSGDATVTRNVTKTRVNSSGLIESMANNVLAPDYLNGVCPALNVEGQATNFYKYSQDFSNSYWNKTSLGSGSIPVVTANSVTSPSGSLDADKILFDRGSGDNSGDRSIIELDIPGAINVSTEYTGSIYLKASTTSDIGKEILFSHLTNTDFKIITLTATWVRYTITDTSVEDRLRFFLGSIGSTTTGNAVNVDVWGAQFEEGIEATSYIPTTTAQVTRSADTVTIPIPSGTTEIIEKYEDGTTNTITTIPASTYTVPTGKRYEYILMR